MNTVNAVNILDKAALETEQDRKSATLERLSLLAKEFRLQMSAIVNLDLAQDSEPACKYGEYRETFYNQVIDEAEKVWMPLSSSAQKLTSISL